MGRTSALDEGSQFLLAGYVLSAPVDADYLVLDGTHAAGQPGLDIGAHIDPVEFLALKHVHDGSAVGAGWDRDRLGAATRGRDVRFDLLRLPSDRERDRQRGVVSLAAREVGGRRPVQAAGDELDRDAGLGGVELVERKRDLPVRLDDVGITRAGGRAFVLEG